MAALPGNTEPEISARIYLYGGPERCVRTGEWGKSAFGVGRAGEKPVRIRRERTSKYGVQLSVVVTFR